MKRIKDPVHGYIDVSDEFITHIIDTADFQRLRYLRQLSATHMIYPSANHSRFEHSLGVYYLGKRAFETLCEDDEFSHAMEDRNRVKRTLLCACLLHDIGHPPFSHVGETLLEKEKLLTRLDDLGLDDKIEEAGIRTGFNPSWPLTGNGTDEGEDGASEHELLSCVMVLDRYRDALEHPDVDVDPFEVCGYILGVSLRASTDGNWADDVASDLLHSAMDIDRLDYITRDNFMTGATVTNVDVERMIRSYTTCDESLVFSDKALSTVRNYLEGRIAVYQWVTQHHKSVFANALLRELLLELDDLMQKNRGERLVTVEKILHQQIDETYVLQMLREFSREYPDSRLASLFDRYRRRDYIDSCWKHKVAYYNKLTEPAPDNFSEWVGTKPDYIRNQLLDSLADEYGHDVESDQLWVELSYVPEYDPSELRGIRIAYEDEARSVASIGLYNGDDYFEQVPYVFAPDEYEEDVIQIINDEFS